MWLSQIAHERSRSRDVSIFNEMQCSKSLGSYAAVIHHFRGSVAIELRHSWCTHGTADIETDAVRKPADKHWYAAING
jgi:hypothetical protein